MNNGNRRLCVNLVIIVPSEQFPILPLATIVTLTLDQTLNSTRAVTEISSSLELGIWRKWSRKYPSCWDNYSPQCGRLFARCLYPRWSSLCGVRGLELPGISPGTIFPYRKFTRHSCTLVYTLAPLGELNPRARWLNNHGNMGILFKVTTLVPTRGLLTVPLLNPNFPSSGLYGGFQTHKNFFWHPHPPQHFPNWLPEPKIYYLGLIRRDLLFC